MAIVQQKKEDDKKALAEKYYAAVVKNCQGKIDIPPLMEFTNEYYFKIKREIRESLKRLQHNIPKEDYHDQAESLRAVIPFVKECAKWVSQYLREQEWKKLKEDGYYKARRHERYIAGKAARKRSESV